MVNSSFLYLLGSDNLEIKKNNEFVIYQGSHGDRGAEIADVILPSAAYTEQNSLYENLEGRVQECRKASYPIGESKEDWKIFNLIMKKIDPDNKNLKFELLRKEVKEKILNFTEINELPAKHLTKTNDINCEFISEKIVIKPLDYYYSNSISRASKTMSECRQINKVVRKTG
jgi:NADH dehydrogenase/NADH:ubiquinone oxidoreductase 75 kD subunit (chain G)